MKECFVICPLGDEDSASRKRSDRLLKHVLSPVLIENGFTVIRADQIPKVGLITTQIINLLIESPLVVADLTASNPNVFYELAIRHATRKPYIQLIEKGERIPFDIGAIRTIEIDIADLDSVEKTKTEIGRQVKEFDKGHRPDSPISVATTARLLQDDIDLAGEIADRLSSWNEGYAWCDSGFVDSDLSEKIDQVLRKFYWFNDYGRVTLENLDEKLDRILNSLPPDGSKDST